MDGCVEALDELGGMFRLDDAGDVDWVPTRAFPLVPTGRAREAGTGGAALPRFARSA